MENKPNEVNVIKEILFVSGYVENTDFAEAQAEAERYANLLAEHDIIKKAFADYRAAPLAPDREAAEILVAEIEDLVKKMPRAERYSFIKYKVAAALTAARQAGTEAEQAKTEIAYLEGNDALNAEREKRKALVDAAREMVEALNELQQSPTITLSSPDRIIEARDALAALLEEVESGEL